MDILTGDILEPLMHRQMGICVSVYMPTLRKGTEIQQNQIRYKNLLKKIEESLISSDLRPSEAENLMTPAQELLGDVPFWRNQKDGLALFISEELFRYYRLPRKFKELIVITDRFHLKPLIPMTSSNVEFYILAISQNKVRFFECSRYQSKETRPRGIPENISEALNFDDFEKHLQLHTGSEDTKTNILQYFKSVDRGLRKYLKGKKAALVFAGVDYLYPIYSEANTYPYLVERGISGNPEGLSAEELHKLAWPIVEPIFEKEKADKMAQYSQNAGTGLASDNIEEIVRSSYHGRIGTLFVPVGIQQWGTFNPDTDEVHLSKRAKMGNEDLLDFAAIETLLNGGTVYAVDPKEVPHGSTVAAIFRY
ncbi:MAG: hypothetical protein JXQ25_00565 [Deltaproteobacteria bacterium]|nr:hypothetical protein [Deltaproteobacteria bacterium]